MLLIVAAALPKTAHADASEDAWHKKLLDYAANYDTSQDSNKRQHERIKKSCGHDIDVKFDWRTFKMAEWIGHDMGAGYVSDEVTAGRNCVSILSDLADACEHDELRRPKIALVKTLTCVSIPPAKMPNDHGYSSVWKLSKDGDNIDAWEVPFMMSGLPRASDWITTTFLQPTQDKPSPAPKKHKSHKK